MKLARGGALTALTLLIAIGCGGSEVVVVPGAPNNPADDAGVVESVGPDGGDVDGGLPEAPPPPDGKPSKGVFVSSSKGIEGADGTKARPVKTLAVAIALAEAKKSLPVIACAETFAEAVTLKDGVTLYGYFDCNDDWAPTDKHAKIVSPTSPALLAEGLTSPLRFEGFDVIAPDMSGATTDGLAASSYGAVVRSTQNIAIARTTIRAGRGQDGRDGVEPAQGNVELSSNAGADATTQRPCNPAVEAVLCGTAKHVVRQAGGTSSCKVGDPGGPGGAGGFAPVSRNGVYQQPIDQEYARGMPTPSTAASYPNTALGGAVGTIGSYGGAGGENGQPGTSGTNGAWSFSALGFVPGDGTQGATGRPGKGGGGGAGTTVLWNLLYFSGPAPYPNNELPSGTQFGAAGGGGGAGGCGGVAGAAGIGGGASVGLFVVNSTVDLKDGTRIESQRGGRGGNGTLGTLGTQGGTGGLGSKTAMDGKGAPGGSGGAGGPAGLSGHGAPGPSIALVYTGTRPSTAKDVALVAGAAGDGAPALTRDAQSLPATVGVAKQEHSF